MPWNDWLSVDMKNSIQPTDLKNLKMRISVKSLKIYAALIFSLIFCVAASTTVLHFMSKRIVVDEKKSVLTLKSASWKSRALGINSYTLEFIGHDGTIYTGQKMVQFARALSYEPCFDFYESKVGEKFLLSEETGYFSVPLIGKIGFESNFENNMMYIACRDTQL